MAIQIKKDDLAGFMMKQVRRDFNDFVRYVQKELSKPPDKGVSYSPVLTGFFASSWRVSREKVQPTDDIKAFAPWNAIKIHSTPSPARLAPGQQPFVNMRFPMKTRLRTNITYYVGNSVRYAGYSLASPKNKIAQFVQGDIKQWVGKYFQEKKFSALARAGSMGYEMGAEDSAASIEVETDNADLWGGGDL